MGIRRPRPQMPARHKNSLRFIVTFRFLSPGIDSAKCLIDYGRYRLIFRSYFSGVYNLKIGRYRQDGSVSFFSLTASASCAA